jgi:hypothetical protein
MKDLEKAALLRVAERIKMLSPHDYLNLTLYQRCIKGYNVRYGELLGFFDRLNITPAEFFSEGFASCDPPMTDVHFRQSRPEHQFLKSNDLLPVTGDRQNEALLKVANRLKTVRMERGYFFHEYFSNGHHIGRPLYLRYERGENITYARLSRIFRALQVSPQDFFGEGFD